jgi:hypothetical protein
MGADWSKLQGECFACKHKFLKSKLLTINEKTYCETCKSQIEENITQTCERCNEKFKEKEMEKYYKKWYCKSCKEIEQQARKNIAKIEEEVTFDEFDTLETNSLSEERINEIIGERMIALKNEILQDVIRLIQPQTVGSASERPLLVINKILATISSYDFDTMIKELKQIYDLEKFETITLRGRNFFYYMENIQREREIITNSDKYEIARLINRVYRGDANMYRTVVKVFKDLILEVIQNLLENQ